VLTHPTHRSQRAHEKCYPIISALAAGALTIAPATASADGMRVSVCAQQLELNTAPDRGREVLAKGGSFRVRKLNPTAKYADGLAYGVDDV
jgi:hypothetical protein